MAHLNRPERYDIADSNIALLGSDLELRVREHAGDKETAWELAGQKVGLEIWRIEDFHVATWPQDRKGVFYDGDSYIVLHTYKKDPNSEALSYDLHFWLGENTSQDEAGTAAYKTVELDDHLHGTPVQYREVQGYESAHFLSYFPHFLCLKGGVATGFHHVSSPPLEEHRLYRICAISHAGHSQSRIAIRQVTAEAASLQKGDVFVLDLGAKVLQYNTRSSSGKEKFSAAEFVRSLVDSRKGKCELNVYDEGGHGAGIFLSQIGADSLPPRAPQPLSEEPAVSLFRLSDASGTLTFEPAEQLSTSDAFLADNTSSFTSPAVYVWVGREASLAEKRLGLQYAQRYLHDKCTSDTKLSPATTIVLVKEGAESEAFLHALRK